MKTFMTILAAGMMTLAMTGTAQALDAKVFVFYEDTDYQGPILGFYSGSYGGPGCAVTYLAGDVDWSTYSFSGVDLLWVVPADNFSTDEISTMASVLSGGGRIGFLGAWYDRERDDSINAAVASLGGHISINTGYVDNGYPHYAYRSASKILSDPFTDNVNSFVYGIFSPLSVSGSARSLVLGEDGSSVLLACEDIGAGTIFVMTSQSAWDLDPFSAGTDNRTLFTNILNVSFSAPSAPTGVSATDSTYEDKILISWNATSNADNYEIWRNTSGDSAAASKIDDAVTSPYNDNSATAGITYWYWVKAKNSFGTSDFSSFDTGSRKLTPAPGSMSIQKCTVTAGKADMDSISFSGILDALEADLIIAQQKSGNVTVRLNAVDMPQPLYFVFPVTASSLYRSIFRGINTNGTFYLDTRTGRMTFASRGADLTGLACPITVTITIGDYEAELELDEAIVNGTKPCPIQLMQGVKNSLDITKKPSFKKGKKTGTDSLTVSGTFTVKGDYKKAPLVITLGNQTFTVPVEQMGDNSIAKIASCKPASKIRPLITAKLDYNKCTFTISIKNALITERGTVAFGINCFDVNLQGLETIYISRGSMSIQNCSVVAKMPGNLGNIRFSGSLNATEADLLTAMADGNDIIVSVEAEDMVQPQKLPFPITTASLKKGKFSSKTLNSSFALDTKKWKMAFSAKNVDLTGLACLITVTITIGNYEAQLKLSETVVNGTKPCPLPLMQGVKNSLDITKKPSFKKDKKTGTGSLTVSGTFTVASDYKKAPLVITLGNQTFTVPIEQMGDNPAAKIASCKPASKIGPLITAKLDYNKCTFTISIKNASINQTGDVAFGINCFDVNLQSIKTINLNVK